MGEQRTSPLRSQLVLWIGFALIAVASVFTVLVPELSDAGDAEDGEAPSGEPR